MSYQIFRYFHKANVINPGNTQSLNCFTNFTKTIKGLNAKAGSHDHIWLVSLH